MKIDKFLLTAMAAAATLAACDDKAPEPGNPVLESLTTFTSAYFADSLQFAARVSDAAVPLSTLKAQLFFGDEMVSETVIRTKTGGEYSGKIFIPFYADIPDAEATLKLALQNIHFTKAEQTFVLPVSRPDFPGLKLVMKDGTEKTMARTAKNEYAVTDDFDAKVNAYIVAPAFGANGNDVMFGMVGGNITQGSKAYIPFSSTSAGNFAITFNTLTYEAGPFVIVRVNGTEFRTVDNTTSAAVISLTKGDEMTFEGIPDIEEWWMNPSFFDKDGDRYTFRAIGGHYRIVADFARKYFAVQACASDGSLLTLKEDGTGALWIIGDDIGFPNLSNEVGWTTEKGICMAQIESRKYQVILTATDKTADRTKGTVHSKGINFKFFHQQGWGGEFGDSNISAQSAIVKIGDGGNLALADGTELDEGGVYVFTVEVSSSSTAVLIVEKE